MHHKGNLEVRIIAAGLLAAFLATGCVCLRSAGPEADSTKARSGIERRLQEVFTAAETKDFERLDSYHLYGPKFTKFQGPSPERLDAAAGRKGEHDGLAALTGLKMRADNLKIDVFGNVGIATFILDSRFDRGGEVISSKQLSTLVFVKDRRDWKIVHEHFSPVKP